MNNCLKPHQIAMIARIRGMPVRLFDDKDLGKENLTRKGKPHASTFGTYDSK